MDSKEISNKEWNMKMKNIQKKEKNCVNKIIINIWWCLEIYIIHSENLWMVVKIQEAH